MDSEVIGSWKMSAICLPRMSRISRPTGSSLAMSSGGRPSRLSQISPPTSFPGRSRICRIERVVTLLPQPDSPTMPSVLLGHKSKDALSTACTTPSSWMKQVSRLRTDSNGVADMDASAIGVRRIAQSVAEEVEGKNDGDHRHGRYQQPRCDRQRLHALSVLQQDAPADRRGAQAQPQEAQACLGNDHGRQRKRD